MITDKGDTGFCVTTTTAEITKFTSSLPLDVKLTKTAGTTPHPKTGGKY